MGNQTLTQKLIKSLVPRAEAYTLTDDEVPGFYVRVARDGQRSFYLKYRIAGRQRKITIGRFGDITPDQARRSAERFRQMAREGIDPAAERDAAKAALTVKDAWLRFTEQNAVHWRQSTATEYDRQFKKHIAPMLGARAVASIDRASATALHYKLRNTPITANRVLASLSSFLTFCRDQGFVTGDNPCSGVKRYKETVRERVLTDDEIARLGSTLDAYNGNVFAKAGIRLILLLGCRKMEVLGMRWSEVDLERRMIRLPETKTGARTIYLGDEAVALLESLPHLPNNPYVVCGHVKGTHLRDVKTTWETICTLAKIEGATIHDLRRTYGSRAVSNGADLFMVSKLLGHSTVRMTEQAYAFMKDDAKAEASRQISESMSKALTARRDNVVQIGGKR